MENIRCLIADIPHIILADILQKITENRSGIEIIDRIDSTNNLPKIVKDRAIDVLMFGLEEISELQSLDEIFEVSPQIVAVGIVGNGRRICVCVEDIGPDEFSELIKAAVNKKSH